MWQCGILPVMMNHPLNSLAKQFCSLCLLREDRLCPLLISSVVFFILQTEVFHLTPNSIVHISIFVHLCEAFLGIRPHFNLFCYFFRLKLHPDAEKPKLLGVVGFQLHQQVAENYLEYSTPRSLSGWHATWFYIKNRKPGLPRQPPPPSMKVSR